MQTGSCNHAKKRSRNESFRFANLNANANAQPGKQTQTTDPESNIFSSRLRTMQPLVLCESADSSGPSIQ